MNSSSGDISALPNSSFSGHTSLAALNMATALLHSLSCNISCIDLTHSNLCDSKQINELVNHCACMCQVDKTDMTLCYMYLVSSIFKWCDCLPNVMRGQLQLSMYIFFCDPQYPQMGFLFLFTSDHQCWHLMLHRMETPAHQCPPDLVVTLRAAQTNHPISLQAVPVYIYNYKMTKNRFQINPNI